MDFSKLSDRERLIAEQAVEALRALDKAADDAVHGKGLACMEACMQDKGFALIQSMMTSTASARPEAQKKGSASGPAPVATHRSLRTAGRARS